MLPRLMVSKWKGIRLRITDVTCIPRNNSTVSTDVSAFSVVKRLPSRDTHGGSSTMKYNPTMYGTGITFLVIFYR